jgi:DNA primase
LLVEAGLVVETDDGRRYDRFRERIMFPIRNARGHLVGFGGRVVGKGEPKYLNSPETPIFSKGQELYGLWEGRDAIRREGHVLVVEGYMDVVGLAQQGIENAVATLGTATTAHHIQKLLRVADKIIFSFDGDAAGRRAAWRALQTCLPLLRDDISLRFLFLPSNHDPDSFVREQGAQAFRDTVAGAPALSRFMLNELAERHNLDEAEGRAACVHEARPLLLQLPRETTLRVQIEREFAQLVKLTPEELAVHLEAAEQAAREAELLREAAHASRGSAQGLSNAGGSQGHVLRGMTPSGVTSRGTESQRMASDEAYSEPVFDNLSTEPPGFMDDAAGAAGSVEPYLSTGGLAPSRSVLRGQGSRRGGFSSQGRTRAVTPMAKRLLRLLLGHPELVDGLGDQQLETLARGPHLSMVRALVELISSSGARHVGAILQAAEPESELAQVLRSVSSDVLMQTDLPEPMAEWNDAMHKVEVEVIRAEQSQLIAAGLPDAASRERYQLLTRRLTKLSGQ